MKLSDSFIQPTMSIRRMGDGFRENEMVPMAPELRMKTDKGH